MEDKELEYWLHQLKEEHVDIPEPLLQHTQSRIKRSGFLSMLLMIVIWSCVIQLVIGTLLIVVIPGLQQEWIWEMLILTEASFLIIQLAMIWGLRNREELPSLGDIRSILQGGNIVE